jgi:DNA-binding NarL/FixJ family response regulator
VEDRPEVLHGVKRALSGDPRCSLVSACATLREAIDAVRRNVVAEVALLDLGLPDGSGLTLLPVLKDALPDCKAVIWTQFDDDESLFEALKLGAAGYLLKSTPGAELVLALLEASGGGAPMTPAIARRVLASFRSDAPPSDRVATLSERERLVLRQLSHGYSYAEIAEQLGVSLATVQTFIRRIYTKLDVHSKAEATRLAARSGLT